MDSWVHRPVLAVALWCALASGPGMGFALGQGSGQTERLPYYAQDLIWNDVNGNPVTFSSEEEILAYLRDAEVISRETLEEGINDVEKVVLEKDGIRMHAAFRHVRVRKDRTTLSDGTVLRDFRDDCMFEIAAYHLSKLLDIHIVPPVVRRKVGRRNGSLQLWVEGAMTENQRVDEDVKAPNAEHWKFQWQVVRVFDNLIYNLDRNRGNLLIDSGWKVWMIDHTRAFTYNKELRSPRMVQHCDRVLLEKLRGLEKDSLKKETRGYLNGKQINRLLARRDLLVARIDDIISRNSEAEILF